MLSLKESKMHFVINWVVESKYVIFVSSSILFYMYLSV